jgi:hypothetical protein
MIEVTHYPPGLLQGLASPAWHAYRIEERHAPWKVFLPLASKAPVLAVELQGNFLASLARSRGDTVYVHNCQGSDLAWALDHGSHLGHSYRFKEVEKIQDADFRFGVIVVGTNARGTVELATVLRWLEPGGAAVWAGPASQLPSTSELTGHGFQSIHKYAILPPGSSKILVPLGDARATHAGLNLYKPFKRRSRMAVKLAHLLTGLGFLGALGRKQVVVARKAGQSANGDYLLDWLRPRLNQPLADAAVYSGWTKMVLQLLGPCGEVIGIAKLADIALGEHGIKREGATLRHLANQPELQHQVPKILAEGRWGSHLVQVQTAVTSGAPDYQTILTPAHREFLLALSRLDRCEGNLKDWPHWEQIWRWSQGEDFAPPGEREALRQMVEECADRLGGEKITFHRIHGDFSPWHAVSGPKGMAVIDWEESEAKGLPFMDALRFVLARDFLLNGKIPEFGQILQQSPFFLGNGRELIDLASFLQVSPKIARLAFLAELFRLRNFWRE